MQVKITISKEEFAQFDMELEEFKYAVSKVMNSSYDCDDGGILLGFGVDEYDVEVVYE